MAVSQRHALDLVQRSRLRTRRRSLECRIEGRPAYGSRSAGRRRLDQSRSTEPRPRAKPCRRLCGRTREAEVSARGRADRRAELDRVGRKAGGPGVSASLHEDVRHTVLSRRSATATAATGRSWRSLRALRASLALQRPRREPERLLSLAAEGPKANVQVALGLVVAAPLRARENEAPLLGLRDEGRRVVLRSRKPAGDQGAQTDERRDAHRNSQQLPDTRVPHLSPPLLRVGARADGPADRTHRRSRRSSHIEQDRTSWIEPLVQWRLAKAKVSCHRAMRSHTPHATAMQR